VLNDIKFWLVRKEIVKIGGKFIPILRFTDNIVIIEISEKHLKTALNEMN